MGHENTGVQNFPTVGLFDGKIRNNMDGTGLVYDKEVEMIRLAHDLDLLTTPYCFTEDEASAMVKAGADLIVAHGGTTGGTIGATDANDVGSGNRYHDAHRDASRRIRKDILVICHGGPFDEPETVEKALKMMPGINGFYGATSMERLPVERAITEQVRKFTGIRVEPLKKEARQVIDLVPREHPFTLKNTEVQPVDWESCGTILSERDMRRVLSKGWAG